MQEIYSSNPPVLTGIRDPKKSRNKYPNRVLNWHMVGDTKIEQVQTSREG